MKSSRNDSASSAGPARGLIAVFRSPAAASAAAEAARQVALGTTSIRLADDVDRRASLRGEMREETAHSVAGPGVAAYTPKMARGALAGIVVASGIGMLLALPLGFIPVAGIPLAGRLLIAGIVGLFAGGAFGFVVGGGAGASASTEAFASERGVTVGVESGGDDLEAIAGALRAHEPLRIDRFDGGEPTTEIDLDAAGRDESAALRKEHHGDKIVYPHPRGPVDASGMPGDSELTETRPANPRR